MFLYLKTLLFYLRIFCICPTSPNNLFVEEIYSDYPKYHDVMSWLNFKKKHIWLIFIDDENIQVVK